MEATLDEAMKEVMHQKSKHLEGIAARRGEATSQTITDETTFPRLDPRIAGQDLLEQVLARENMQIAWKRVKSNKGAAGVDGLDILQTQQHLKEAWPAIREQLKKGSYSPQPVRRVGIPKSDGSERELGIPTVTDRLIQQALLQVLQPLIDPTFSEHSYGFRPRRSARDAVLKARHYVQQGYRIVVDVDLSKFFDRVNHDILIGRLKKRISDPSIIRLIRAYLNAGIMHEGIKTIRGEGTPQGGPLSPLLANILLDEVDQYLEKRGHHFVRYADDCNVYVGSRKAGSRVMAMLKRCYDKLCLTINETKSAVASAFQRKFLGYSFWVAPKGEIKLRVAEKARDTFKEKIRQITRRSNGRSIEEVIEKLRSYVLGWKAYFNLAETPRVWRTLDEWMRRRMRAIHLKHWKRGRTMFRELIKLGANPRIAQTIAAQSRRWWRNSKNAIHNVLTIAYFDSLGMPRLG